MYTVDLSCFLLFSRLLATEKFYMYVIVFFLYFLLLSLAAG